MNILDPAGSIHDAATPACIQQSQPNPDQSRVSSFRLSIHFFKLLIYFNNIIWFDLEQVQRSSISRLRDVSFAGTPPPSPIRQLRARHCLTKGQWELVLQCNSVGSNTIVRLRSPRRRRRSITTARRIREAGRRVSSCHCVSATTHGSWSLNLRLKKKEARDL
jgi:hypothetical protein